ncbi:MAG: hypothetical protein QW701_05010 [Candidatus Nezhaarchaeales archaeon]
MKVKVNFLAVLRSLAKSSSIEVDVPQGIKIIDIIRLACKDNESLLKRVFEPSGGNIRSDIIVMVDGVDVNVIGGVNTSQGDIKEISLIPSVHGGSNHEH